MKTKKGAPTLTPDPYAATSPAAPTPAAAVPTTVSLPPDVPAPPQLPQVPFQYPPMFNPYMINPMAAYLQGFNMPGMAMAMPGMPMPGMPMPMPMMPRVDPFSPHKEGPSSPRKERSSSPIANMLGGVHGFCESYRISESEELALDKLGFELGDDLGQVTEQQYEAVGFKTLAWMRVLKAYKKFKRENKN